MKRTGQNQRLGRLLPVTSAAINNPYQLVDGRHGRFLVNPNDFYIGRGLIEYGEYADAEWRVLDQLLRPGKDAIEVGANIGAHSVAIARKLDGFGRRLMVIEPQPVVFQNLCANLALNGLLNVLAENAAVSNTSGNLRFVVPDYRRPGSNFGAVTMRADDCTPNDDSADGVTFQRVRCVRLDDLAPEDFNVGLIKIDVEGFELQVLESAVKTIERHRPVLYVENDRLESSQALIEWLWAADYELYWNRFFLFNPNNYRGKSDNLFIDGGRHIVNVNMLALPARSATTIEGFSPVTSSEEHPLA